VNPRKLGEGLNAPNPQLLDTLAVFGYWLGVAKQSGRLKRENL
jgi:hypothetical protein